ncbi:MazG-like family protein [Clostridium sp. JN-1]|jgi:Icc-related predicted phosphoesterase|uniref:MazG-like family protein n=1 Tax=Clostridium sp. JN-1 TaxID=2483110 RepID=UPI000F0BBCBB|nr:MazG-like family protein [Clostridium sp. JN-1]
MKKDDLNIMNSIKVIEELKADLLCIIGDLFKLLTKGSNVAHQAILDCISGGIIIFYLLADRLGYSHAVVDDNVLKKLKVGIIEKDKIEKDGRSLSKLYNHLKQKE